MFSLRALLLSAGALLSISTWAAEAPKTFDNEYRAKLYGFNITVTNRLTKADDGNYHLLFKADSMIGSITEQSHMQWNKAQQTISPLKYTYARRGLGKDRNAELTFDWNGKTVTNNVQKTSWEMDIAQKVQDKLSYQLQMQQDLLNGHKDFEYQIADGGHLKKYKFTTVGEEMLDTPLGKVKTVKIKRSREDNDRVTYAWLAKDWNYLLVRLQQEEKGDTYTIYIHKAVVDGKSITQF
ncbi:hypothetical protein CBP51_16390 [Cellvibrio mixtus]|uniref:DUF3108 domain-containing protein n=1 Tax=Cellvibrio mixtus TaxID=39650 RepID=A0A266Q540_9GAMM|nr:DUF3108 domain-containing protein [Cellvibrio mixtus]OZY84746.1 hypothetical protein CBP51_16390 [Cellvibrio mixtus]